VTQEASAKLGQTYRPSTYDRALATLYVFIDCAFVGGLVGGLLLAAVGRTQADLRQPADAPLLGPIVGYVFLAVLVAAFWVTRRARVQTEPNGIRVVRFLGRTQRFPWATVADFIVVGFYPYGATHYGAGRWFVVEARLVDGRTVLLHATERPFTHAAEVAQVCDELNVALARATARARGTMAPASDIAAGDARLDASWPIRNQAAPDTPGVNAIAAPARHRFRAIHPWLTMVAQITTFTLFVLVSVGGLADLFTWPRTPAVVVSALLLVLAVLAIGLLAGLGAMRTEQWLRRDQVVAAAFAADSGASPGGRFRGWVSGGYGPAMSVFQLAVLILAAIASIGFTDQVHDAGLRSASVQATGVHTTGEIVAIVIVSPPTELTVRLAEPIAGTSTTVIHEPFLDSAAAIGDVRAAIVDRQDASYAEIPGTPFVGPDNWLWVAGTAVLWASLAAAWGLWLVRLLRFRMRQRRLVTAPATVQTRL
jgi:hypothetical protein